MFYMILYYISYNICSNANIYDKDITIYNDKYNI